MLKLVRVLLLVSALALSLLAGCARLPLADGETAIQQTPPIATASLSPATPAPKSTPVTPTLAGPVTLRVWVPPQFDPNAGSPAGDLLKARLEAYRQRRPGVRVDVRVKAADGPAGLLESLTAASGAAPLALPDLIALPRPVLETAALKGLLHPLDGLSLAMQDPDWYDYARQMSLVQSSTFGLPFAGDALLLVYRPANAGTPPKTWQAAVEGKGPLAFPAADPQALFALAQYQSLGGAVRDDQGRPVIAQAPLTRVLTFFQEAEASGAMPYWLTQYQGDEQSWQGFLDGRSEMVVTWSSRYLANPPAETQAAAFPTADGAAFTLANGWVWALVGSQADRQEKAVQLAEFLTESDFLADWSEAAGVLPPRPTSLLAWPVNSPKTLMDQISTAAHLYPSEDVLTSLGPPLEQATIQVLKKQADAEAAAKAAVAEVTPP